MTRFKQSSIKRKLTWIIMLTSCIALLLACAAFVIYELFSFRSNLVSELSTLADFTGKNCAATLSFNLPNDAQTNLAYLSSVSQVTAACIYKEGRVWATYPPNSRADAFPTTPAAAGHRFENDSLVLFKPILDPDNGEQIGLLFLQSNLTQMYLRIRQYIEIASAVLVLSLIVALALSARLQRLVS